eukprot:3342464-Rhodomonas_salina.1
MALQVYTGPGDAHHRVAYEPKKQSSCVLDSKGNSLWSFSSDKEYSDIEWHLGIDSTSEAYVLYVVKTEQKTLCVHHVRSNTLVHSITGEDDVTNVNCLQHGPIALVQRGGTKFEVLHFERNEVLAQFEETESWCSSENGKRIAFAEDDSAVRVRDLPTGVPLATMQCDASG